MNPDPRSCKIWRPACQSLTNTDKTPRKTLEGRHAIPRQHFKWAVTQGERNLYRIQSDSVLNWSKTPHRNSLRVHRECITSVGLVPLSDVPYSFFYATDLKGRNATKLIAKTEKPALNYQTKGITSKASKTEV